MINWLVDKFCPVWFTNVQVIRELNKHMKHGFRNHDLIDTAVRKTLYRKAILRHKKNKEIYHVVTCGDYR